MFIGVAQINLMTNYGYIQLIVEPAERKEKEMPLSIILDSVSFPFTLILHHYFRLLYEFTISLYFTYL